MIGGLFRIRVVKFADGERYPILTDTQGTPHWHATLFVTTQLRNNSKAANTIVANLAAVRDLLRWAARSAIDLEQRFATQNFLTEQEIEALCHATVLPTAPQHLSPPPVRRVPLNLESAWAPARKSARTEPQVAGTTKYKRITYVTTYLIWLAKRLVEREARQISEPTARRIQQMAATLRARRPQRTSHSTGKARQGLSEMQQQSLLELITPQAKANPFSTNVQQRNQLIVLFLYHLGIRSGELLSLRVDDLDLQGNCITIARRHDDIFDPRAHQPVAKTADRRVPISDALASKAAAYVLNDRRHVPGAKRHLYLFVTHRAGPFQGAPLSSAGLRKMFADLQSRRPEHLARLSPHLLRHTANDRFSALMDQGRVEPAREDKMRSYLMGWKEGSGTAAVYTRRHVEKAARLAALKLQES